MGLMNKLRTGGPAMSIQDPNDIPLSIPFCIPLISPSSIYPIQYPTDIPLCIPFSIPLIAHDRLWWPCWMSLMVDCPIAGRTFQLISYFIQNR